METIKEKTVRFANKEEEQSIIKITIDEQKEDDKKGYFPQSINTDNDEIDLYEQAKRCLTSITRIDLLFSNGKKNTLFDVLFMWDGMAGERCIDQRLYEFKNGEYYDVSRDDIFDLDK